MQTLETSPKSALHPLLTLRWVVLVASAAAALTSWMEFSDSSGKAERYTRAALGLRELIDWWASLSDVEKASKSATSQLVRIGERVIREERQAWTSTSLKSVDVEGGDTAAAKGQKAKGDGSGSKGKVAPA